MKAKLILLNILAMFIVLPSVYGQTRILVGMHGGGLYSNTTLGVLAGIEIPAAPRLEFDGLDEFSAYENHVGLGTGTANLARVSGITWLGKSVGLTGGLEHHEYAVSIHKDHFEVLGGVILRHVLAGNPTRIEFDYLHSLKGQFKHGIEPSYLQGGRVAVIARLGCYGPFCYRLDWEVQAGKVLLQGNPLCDGTIPPIPTPRPMTCQEYNLVRQELPCLACQRQGAISGGAKASFVLEFPRRHKTENEAF